jgi:hypothetical protein
MILLRLTEHLRTQNWLAVAIEFVIVVAGVVIGFQITSWNETQQDYRQEALILERLNADFVDIEERSSAGVVDLIERVDGAREMARLATIPVDEIDVDVFGPALQNSIGTLVPTGRSATYVELLTSGEMRLIRSENLRLALVRFDEQVRRQELAYETLADMVIGNAGILLTVQSLNDAVDTSSPQRYLDALGQLRQSPEFLVAARMMVTVNSINHRWHSETHARAQEVLAALNTETAP